ncbi:KCH1 [Candida pseudojiufengensis]|uniref:KCH1 n=1 Tax=Candida pseudojiufengensis TaxID=497109 RepID=UPI002224C59E|nr:KCH1 [Candida pseudojiufengensis]KAI5960786.1 KCH1 [Candida pseudojiufengensis]
MADQKLRDHLDADRAIKKYDLNLSTFNMVKINDFHNYNCSTIFWYFYMWIIIFLSLILLAIDIYSCLNILVFHKWGTGDYKPYAYSIAKWIFTGCIIFQFILLIYYWIWAIHIYKSKNIALVYLSSICKKIYSIKNYNYFCLFNSIDEGKFFDVCCFLSYYEIYENALQILIADTPRQVINVLTLRYYATGGELNNDILGNIQEIAKTNLNLSIILSFMCLSVFIYAIFFFKFLFGIIMYIPLKCVLVEGKYRTLKSYCSYLINESVSQAVMKHHRSKREMLEEGIVSEERFNKIIQLDKYPSDYKDYTRVYHYSRTDSNESIPMNDITSSKTHLLQNNNETQPSLHQKPSYDHIPQFTQQQEQVFSTLSNNKDQVPFNRRLSQLQEKNYSRTNKNDLRKPSNSNSIQSQFHNNDQRNPSNSNAFQSQDQVQDIFQNNPDQYSHTGYNPQLIKNLPGETISSINPLIKNPKTRLPSKPSRSYTPTTIDTYNTRSNPILQNKSLVDEGAFELPELELDNFTNSSSVKPLVKSSTEQFHYNNNKSKNVKNLQRSCTDELNYQKTNNVLNHSIPSRKVPNPFNEEEELFFQEPPRTTSNQINNSPPISRYEDEILDAYDLDNEFNESNKDVNGNNLSVQNNSVPYPVRGVSKYFDSENQRF